MNSSSDDNSTAKHLYETVRVLCYVPVSNQDLRSKAVHVQRTWGRHCNKLIFFAEPGLQEENKADLDINSVVGLGIADSGSNNLTEKMFASMRYLYEHHLHEFEWFLKADTDTYVVAENLRYLLSDHEPSKPIYFGHHFKVSQQSMLCSRVKHYLFDVHRPTVWRGQGYNTSPQKTNPA